MTETAARLRWEPGEDGILFGYSGTLKPWVFAICPPSAPGGFWMISTPFPLGQPRYVGSEKEARNAAERWLAGFVSSLGAVFPDMLREIVTTERVRRDEAAGVAPNYELQNRYWGWTDALDWVLTLIDPEAERMARTERADTEG